MARRRAAQGTGRLAQAALSPPAYLLGMGAPFPGRPNTADRVSAIAGSWLRKVCRDQQEPRNGSKPAWRQDFNYLTLKSTFKNTIIFRSVPIFGAIDTVWVKLRFYVPGVVCLAATINY